MKAKKTKKRGAPKGNKNAGNGADKVKLTCWILSCTRQAIGPKPGAVLDARFGVENDLDQRTGRADHR